MLLRVLILASSLGQLALGYPSATMASVALSIDGTSANGTSANGTSANGTDCSCLVATGVSWGIGFFLWPLLLLALGFCCGGIFGGSCAAGCQSLCYGGSTGGCFSVFQSCGAGGSVVGYVLCCLVWASIIAVGVYFSCVSVCQWLY